MQEKIKVLLAEDEQLLGKIIKEALESRAFEVVWVLDGVKAFSKFRTEYFDICLLDVMMPLKDGFTLAKELRSINAEIPIIFLTSKSATEDVVEGFESGANDYIRKPFSMEELIVRMKALTRKLSFQKQTVPDDVQIGSYIFNFNRQTLTLEQTVQNLSFKEAALLKLLFEHKNDILDRNVALSYLWGDDSYFNARSMDVFITKLRKYLSGDERLKIINIRGIGFKLLIE